MNQEELDKLWAEVKHIGEVEKLDYDAMLALGSVFGKLSAEIRKQNSINQLCLEAYETAVTKGWHDKEHSTTHWLAMIHSEVSEALEADRVGDREEFVKELADICIRTFDYCGMEGIDLETAIIEKMAYNKTRPIKHGNKLY